MWFSKEASLNCLHFLHETSLIFQVLQLFYPSFVFNLSGLFWWIFGREATTIGQRLSQNYKKSVKLNFLLRLTAGFHITLFSCFADSQSTALNQQPMKCEDTCSLRRRDTSALRRHKTLPTGLLLTEVGCQVKKKGEKFAEKYQLVGYPRRNKIHSAFPCVGVKSIGTVWPIWGLDGNRFCKVHG